MNMTKTLNREFSLWIILGFDFYSYSFCFYLNICSKCILWYIQFNLRWFENFSHRKKKKKKLNEASNSTNFWNNDKASSQNFRFYTEIGYKLPKQHGNQEICSEVKERMKASWNRYAALMIEGRGGEMWS